MHRRHVHDDFEHRHVSLGLFRRHANLEFGVAHSRLRLQRHRAARGAGRRNLQKRVVVDGERVPQRRGRHPGRRLHVLREVEAFLCSSGVDVREGRRCGREARTAVSHRQRARGPRHVHGV